MRLLAALSTASSASSRLAQCAPTAPRRRAVSSLRQLVRSRLEAKPVPPPAVPAAAAAVAGAPARLPSSSPSATSERSSKLVQQPFQQRQQYGSLPPPNLARHKPTFPPVDAEESPSHTSALNRSSSPPHPLSRTTAAPVAPNAPRIAPSPLTPLAPLAEGVTAQSPSASGPPPLQCVLDLAALARGPRVSQQLQLGGGPNQAALLAAQAAVRHAPSFTVGHTVSVLTSLAKLGIGEAAEAALLPPLAEALCRTARSLSPEGAAKALSAAAALRLGAAHPPALDAAIAAAVRLCPRFNALDASMALRAAARLGLSDPAVVLPLAASAARLAPAFNSIDVSTCVWSVAKLGVRDPRVLQPLLNAVAACAARGSFDAMGAVMSLRAVAVLGVAGQPAVLQPLLAEAVRLAPSYNAQDACNSLWAAVTLGVADDAILAPLALAAARKASAFTDAADACQSLWAVARLDIGDDEIVQPLLRAAARLAPSFSPQDASTALWAVATLGVGRAIGAGVHPLRSSSDEAGTPAVLALLAAAVRRAPVFNAQNASNCLWAAASLGITDRPSLAALREAALRQLCGMTPPAMRQLLQAHHLLSGAMRGPLLGEPELERAFSTLRRGRSVGGGGGEEAGAGASSSPGGSPSGDRADPNTCAPSSSGGGGGNSSSGGSSPESPTAGGGDPAPLVVSPAQRQVGAALESLGLAPRSEVPVFRGLLSADVVVQVPGGAAPFAVEFDGPTHFLRCVLPPGGAGGTAAWQNAAAAAGGSRGGSGAPADHAADGTGSPFGAGRRGDDESAAAAAAAADLGQRLVPNGNTVLRDRLLRAAGYSVVAIPYSDWGLLRGDRQLQAVYLAARLGMDVSAR